MGRPRDLEARDRILRSTYDLITTPDADASINAIVARAGVGKATVYRWWRSRTAVVLDALAEFDHAAAEELADDADVWAQLTVTVTALARSFAPPGGEVIKDLLCAVLRGEEESDDIRQQIVRRRLDAVGEVVQAGIDSGEMHADLDVGTVVDTLCGPLYLQLFCGPSDVEPEVAAENVLNVLRSGLNAASPTD